MSEASSGASGRAAAVFVIGAPGSRAPILARALAGLEGAAQLELAAAVGPGATGDRGDRLEAADWPGEPERQAGDATGIAGAPRLSLQIPYLDARVAPAKFIFCWRRPAEALLSAYAGWESGAFVTDTELDGWDREPAWSFALVPGWADLVDADLGRVVAEQWERTTRISLEDLARLPAEQWAATSIQALRSDPAAELERLAGFVGLGGGGLLKAAESLRSELEAEPPPGPLPADLQAALGLVQETAREAQAWLAAPPRRRGAGADTASTDSPLRSVHTGSMPELLGQLGCSLLVSTYQAGKLIVARRDGVRLNTHFRNFDQPMGLALDGGRLAIGTRSAVLDYRNLPAAAERVEPRGSHDACFIHRSTRVTGDVRIHDVAFAEDGLWFVATAFSCLATLDADHNFVPRWTPPFVSRVSLGDRCHLNGMEVVDGRVRWATALGRTDAPGGWRKNKASGGCLIDVQADEVVIEGLSMPHSPRWHDGRLWILESGRGRLCVADPGAGTVESVAELPGFTRGLAFAGPIAFVGLSQVRETATFGGLPLTERLSERQCGVWAVDTRSGEIAGFLRFEDAVQEVYDVLVLAGVKWPEIAEAGDELTRSSYVIKGWKETQRE